MVFLTALVILSDPIVKDTWRGVPKLMCSNPFPWTSNPKAIHLAVVIFTCKKSSLADFGLFTTQFKHELSAEWHILGCEGLFVPSPPGPSEIDGAI